MAKRKNKNIGLDIDPDQILIDSSNLPSFDLDQMEGLLEKPIAKSAFIYLGVFFAAVILIFVGRAVSLEIFSGKYFADRSESNSLKRTAVPSPRGIIYDRRQTPLAWSDVSGRSYMDGSGLAHLIGYVGYPTQEEADSSATTTLVDLIGKTGVEKKYNDMLRGVDGKKITEVNARGEVQSEYLYEPGHPGENITLSVDSRVTKKFYEYIKNLAAEYKFQGGAGVIMDVNSGELLAMVSYPEYEPAILSKGDDHKAINQYLKDQNKPFLNRAISGTYTPGSIVKPIFALAALNEAVITPKKQILSIGYISIPNPFFPDKKSIFKDWRAQGYVDMRRALSVSSDVYFYEIGGGFENQKGLGIEKLDAYAKIFGLGTTTNIGFDEEAAGNIPTPLWKAENFNGDIWRIGDTYISSIGQYGFLVTPLQMARVAAAIATNGKLIRPKIILSGGSEGEYAKIDAPAADFKVVQEGMREGVTDADGTARALNIPEVAVAAKTGTAELGTTKKLVNSWGIGYFPYENPKFSFALVMERGSRENTVGANLAIRNLLIWMAENTPEYLK